MNPSVKTTHVVPHQLPPVRAKISTLLVCPYCRSTVGAYATPAERTRLETKHICAEKLGLRKPCVSAPFN